jgi:hypothetical protein
MSISFEKIKNETLIALIAIVAITGLEAYALSLGFDGALITLAVGALAGIGGFDVAKRMWKPKTTSGE